MNNIIKMNSPVNGRMNGLSKAKERITEQKDSSETLPRMQLSDKGVERHEV